MEMLSAICGGCVFIAVVAFWIMFCYTKKVGRPALLIGLAVISTPALIAGASLGHYLIIDEPRTLALIDASAKGDCREVSRLLAAGADPNGYFEGETPLKAARSACHKDVAEILTKAGAKE